MQKVCVRLVSGLAESIANSGDRHNARLLLMQILNAFVTKLESIRQTLPGIQKQLVDSVPPRSFPTIDVLTADNIEDFDFEKIRPLWMGTKGVTNAGELLRDARTFFIFMMSRLDSLIIALMTLNPADAPGEILYGFTSDDTQLFARLFCDGFKCVSLFSLERKEPLVLPLRARDGTGLNTDAPEALDIARTLVAVFQKTDLAVFHDVMATNIDGFFLQFMENSQLAILPRLFLASERLGAAYLAVLLSYLVEKLPALGGGPDGVFCSRLLHLFGLAFQTVSKNPSLEHMLTPHLGPIIRACFDHPPQSTEGTHHYLLLSVMFSNLTLTSLERSHAEVIQLLPQLVTDLLLALATTSQGEARDLLLELLLMAYAAVTYMTPLLQHIVRPIVMSLNSGPRLVAKALITLESALDSVSREFLDPVLEPAADQLLYAVTKHLKPLPYDAALSASAARVLGKLGSVNRAFLLHPPHAQSLENCDFAALLEFDGRPQDFSLNLSQLISLAYEVLHDPTADMFYKAQAFKFSRSCLALFIDTNSILPEDVLRLRGKALACLQNSTDQALEFGASTRFIPTPDLNVVALRCEQRARQGACLQKILASIVVCATFNELRTEAMVLVEGLIAHFALIKVTEVLCAQPEFAGEMTQRAAHSIDSSVVVDLLVDAITDSNFKLRQLGITMLMQFVTNCTQLLDDQPFLNRLPVFAEICERLSACCYQEDWIRKERSYVGLTLMVIRLDLGREWLQKQEPRIVASLLYVLKATASAMHYDNIWNALQQVITKAHEYEEGMDRKDQGTRVAQLAGRVLSDLFSANSSLRTAVKAILQLCEQLSGIDLATLIQPFSAQLHTLMFLRPMRSLPIGMMVGAFDAIAFLLDARPSFIRGEDHLLAFIAECLALLDSEDAAFKTRDERLMARFRVKCMGVIMAALSFVENIAHPNILRARAIRVFFKFLHSDTVEMAEAASHSLKQLMTQQSKLPKDLLQDVLKPYLASISDYASMTMAHLKGLARLLEILTHYFKLEIGAKLLDCLKYRAKSLALEEAAESYLADHEDIKMIAAVLNVFAFLPPSGRIFLKDLVPATIDMERLLRRSLDSPFRAPLIHFLARHSSDAVQYFYDHLSDERYCNLFVAAIWKDSSGNLCNEIMSKPDQLIMYTYDTPAHRSHFVGIVRACCRTNKDWLLHSPNVLERLIAMWRTPERLHSGTILSLAQLREIHFLARLLILTISQEGSRIGLYFDLASALSMPTSADLTPVRAFFRTQALCSSIHHRRALLAHFLQLPPDTPHSHLAVFLHYLINPLVLVGCVRKETDQFMDKDLVSMLSSRVWDGPIARIQDDFLRLGTIQLTSLLSQYASPLLEGYRKEVVRFGSSYLRVDNMVCRQAAHLLLARFIAAFGSSDNVIMVVYSALLKTTVMETKPMVRLALDAIVTVFPNRPPRHNEDPRFPVWIRFTKQSLSEEMYNMSHMINIFQFIGRHLPAFFEYRKHFIPQMVYVMPKLCIHDTNPDSKGLLIQLAEMLYKWEKSLLCDVEEPRAKRAKTTASESQKEITPLMKDITITSLIRLFCSCGDPILRKQHIMHSLGTIRDLLSLTSWTEAATPPSLFEEVLRFSDTEEKKMSIIFSLELLHVIVRSKPSSWLRANIRGLRECLASCIRANNYSISCALHPLLNAIFSTEFNGDPELAHLQAQIEESVQKGLSDNATIGSALTLLDTLHQPEIVDTLVATLTRLFQRLAKEHINSTTEKRISAPSPIEQLRNTYSILASSSILTAADSHSNSILLTLNILKRRISHLGDHRKTLLSSMGLLLEKSNDRDLLRSLFRVVSEWLLRASESFPTAKEKANLLVSMVEIGPRCDSQLLADYLQLILNLYEDKNLAHSELTVKLESAFMLGTRADPPSTRGRFLYLLDESIPRPLPLRLKYILGVHDWEKLAPHYWIPQATYLLAGALRLNTPLRPAPLTLSLSSISLPSMASTCPPGSIHKEFLDSLKRFWASLRGFNTRDLILPAQHLAALRPVLQSELWARLFASAWTTLSEVERSDTIKLTITLLSKPYHLKQNGVSPNVVQSLLAGLEECRPYVVLPPRY
ncbi:transcription-associated protein 1 [Entomophthora muscae]|uniref:Transcription-associated protein 1 n=1 Tax=Entomophthora muscae TaxID=34485 RepID=A0ACC2UQS9_9FUNG|nr:transcription-associated protein 1 [Entomophthora muscae]